MPSRAGSVAPFYLLACLVLGGSSQAFWQNLVLLAAGVMIIGWVAVSRPDETMSPDSRLLLLLAAGALVLVALQAVPWPSLLKLLGLRLSVPDDRHLFGESTPGLPLSLVSLATLLGLIPPIAMFCAMLRVNVHRLGLLLGVLLAGTLAGVILTALQVAIGLDLPWRPIGPAGSWLRFGPFANGNQMASLLLISLPFIAAIGDVQYSSYVRSYPGLLALLFALAAVFLIGLMFTGSPAGYALLVPVLCLSALFFLPRWRRYIVVAGILSFVAALAAGHENVLRERAIYAHHLPFAFGWGVGGMLLVALFLGWWIWANWDVWNHRRGGRFVRAASIASAVVLIESLLGLQLLAPAIGAPFAMCVALLANRQSTRPHEGEDLRPTRHVVVA